MLNQLQRPCEERAPLFEPARECAALHALVGEMRETPRPLTFRDTA
jgi:hypothetical protein